ncbi:hypothetical protein K503DRAFT_764744 [Rhizopogon vinicolor AM-OR11-026]|uniref:DinB-like domain-containing protein n=1 Tax=Rhizopogon vinicolor AM-OR11-026 TaxID=1314800 RepID=A0A1B7NJ00_9AGAM|nr:hypothetical protein K503DRAFT_764744 [Rhizopogon vinicolor AM-OR11-026]
MASLSPIAQLQFVSTTVLQQALDLVENILTSDEQLTIQSKFLPGSTIGKHLRHARDHFILLIECVSGPTPYILSYDTRSRNTPMESNLSEAREAFQDVISRIEEVVPTASLDLPLTLNAVTPFMQSFETTFGRELWFAGLHAVHHWSMVRVIAGELDIKLQDDFGFAPSTLVYKGSEALLGKAKI